MNLRFPRLDRMGSLVIGTEGGETLLHCPVIFQERAGAKEPVPGHFVLKLPPWPATGRASPASEKRQRIL